MEEARAACWIRACVVLHNFLVDDSSEPGRWLTAEERLVAQRDHGTQFTRWEREGDDDDHGDVEMGGIDENEESSEGVKLRKRVQMYASMWRAQRGI